MRVAKFISFQLTRREEDVFRLIVGGQTHREISEKLYITKHTAREYIARIYTKVDAHSRSELIEKAISAGLLVLTYKGETIAPQAHRAASGSQPA